METSVSLRALFNCKHGSPWNWYLSGKMSWPFMMSDLNWESVERNAEILTPNIHREPKIVVPLWRLASPVNYSTTVRPFALVWTTKYDPINYRGVDCDRQPFKREWSGQHLVEAWWMKNKHPLTVTPCVYLHLARGKISLNWQTDLL